MEINTSTKYALMAAGYIASHPKDGTILGLTVAKEYNMPVEFLRKILQQLCKAGILQSNRGPHGGFVIGRDPSEITLLQIIEAINGPAFNSNFAEQTKNEPFAIRMVKICDKAAADQKEILSGTTLMDVIKES